MDLDKRHPGIMELSPEENEQLIGSLVRRLQGDVGIVVKTRKYFGENHFKVAWTCDPYPKISIRNPLPKPSRGRFIRWHLGSSLFIISKPL